MVLVRRKDENEVGSTQERSTVADKDLRSLHSNVLKDAVVSSKWRRLINRNQTNSGDTDVFDISGITSFSHCPGILFIFV